jgi:type 1 glutamine amidotransferase
MTARSSFKPRNQPGRIILGRFVLLTGLATFYFTQFSFAAQMQMPIVGHTKSAEKYGTSPSFSVLLFTKTAGFRHSSIPDGIAAITELGQLHNFDVLATEDAAVFTDQQLALHQVVIFLNTTGNILDETQQAALERFIQNGGGFVGIHSASDTEYDWPWYGQLVGAYFANHPAIQSATVHIVDPNHPSTQPLPTQWTRTDEWYNFQALPAPTITILAEVDESTYTGGTMGSPHPIVWSHEFDGGRAWYTAMGHTSASYADPLFRQHLGGGILWAAGRQNAIYLPLLARQTVSWHRQSQILEATKR